MSHVLAPVAPEVLDAILACLRPGAANAQTYAALAAQLGISERKAQAAVDRLLKDRGIGVASSTEPPYGCFLIATEAERERYKAQLNSRMSELRQRLEVVRSCPLFQEALPQSLLPLMGV